MTIVRFKVKGPPEPFRAELMRRGETVVVVASGEIDLASADELEARLRDARTSSGRVVLDLRRVGFIDCAGLSRILELQRAARETGCDFALIPGPSQVQRLFLITGTFLALRFIDPSEVAAGSLSGKTATRPRDIGGTDG
jgi:anti-sigma B factor antagonist